MCPNSNNISLLCNIYTIIFYFNTDFSTSYHALRKNIVWSHSTGTYLTLLYPYIHIITMGYCNVIKIGPEPTVSVTAQYYFSNVT